MVLIIENIIKSQPDISTYFHDLSVLKKESLIGLEVERSAVYNKNLNPVKYAGTSGYLAILKKLAKNFGWAISSQDNNGNIISLKRKSSEIHIEDDGRLEFVSKAHKNLSSLCKEYQIYTNEIDEVSKEFEIIWLSIGWQPFAKNEEITYAFPEKNKTHHEYYQKYFPDYQEDIYKMWEKKSNSIHVNIDYTSEKDAMNKFQTLLKISPILVAMFGNSPLDESKYSGLLINSSRSRLLSCMHRTQIQESFFEKNYSFDKWVDFLLGLPMRRIVRNGKTILIPLTFREFLINGYQSYIATIEDFNLHIKSFWGELRIKKYIEYRGCDTVPHHLVPSIPATIRGLMLNHDVMQECQDLVKNWTFNDQIEMREKVYKHALQAETPEGRKVLDLAKDLLEIASLSLKDEASLLLPIKEYICEKEQSPSEYVMKMWNGEWVQNPRKLIKWLSK
jgi:glutamate--cysteine ligase